MIWFLLDMAALWLLAILVICAFFAAVGKRGREWDAMSERWLDEERRKR